MKIVHFSHTPLVGAPGRISRAISELDDHESRWVVLHDNYGSMEFDIDWLWSEDKEEVIEYTRNADVIHLHNYIDLNTIDFLPINFEDMWKRKVPIVRQFHSHPEFIAKYMGVPVERVITCPIPKLVIAQFQERYYQNAFLVPNIVNSNIEKVQNTERVLQVGFAPSSFRSAHDSRWYTKGYPETRKVLKRIEKKLNRVEKLIKLDFIENVSHKDCIERKSKCDLFIDDLVTGSYHLNTLESLSLGIATMCYIDRRLSRVLREFSGSDEFPVINVGLENIEPVLSYLSMNPGLVRDMGNKSREWMKSKWSTQVMVKKYIQAYSLVANEPHMEFENRFDDSELSEFNIKYMDDLLWDGRRNCWPRQTPKWYLASRGRVGSVLRKLGVIKPNT